MDLGWEDDDVPWGGVQLTSKDFAPVFLDGTDFYILGYGADTPLNSYVERTGLLFANGQFVLGREVWPHIQGPAGGVIQISLGGHDTPEGAITWEGPYNFVIGTDYFVDFAVSGRYLAIRFETSTVPYWTLQSYEIDYEVIGLH